MTADTLAPESIALSPAQASEALRRYYGLEAVSLTLMDSELSSVYRAELSDGRRCAFKATRFTPEAHAAAQWRTAAMDHLQSLGIPAGETFLSLQGQPVTVAETEVGDAVVHVGEWLTGIPLEAVTPNTSIMREVGRTTSRVVAALDGWPQPPVAIEHPWELTRTLETLEATINSATGEEREMLAQATERFRTQVQDQLGALPHTVVHHDLHDSNLLVDGERVSGVLDFGDMVWGPRIAELAVAAGYGCRTSADPAAAYLDILDGWDHAVALTSAEVAVLFPASLGRLAVNLGVWTARSGSDRGDYARARSASTARALRELLAVDPAQMADRISERLLG
ncbi:phosphotransferase [Leucobacter sp. USHLN153]|uniref:phosphotransferase n=1 Tax=Leucobacter sp. USHLN153 TaxID=3081268 RepID=UPI003018F374